MYAESINEAAQRVFAKIAATSFVNSFYLAGGTALAFQLGHRVSYDLDFFSSRAFNVFLIRSELAKQGTFSVTFEDEKTLDGVLDGVKTSFFEYRYALLFPPFEFEGIHIADKRDVAAMKIDAISSRGSKKDFFDLYFLLQEYSLSELIGFFEKRYSDVHYNKVHVLKSIAYFEDAEREPDPNLIKKASWKEVREVIEKEAKKLMGGM